ncbi:hypothetical protein M422DRAFT_249149, partial [Sphaerobolus stellatus SS14]
MSEALLAIRQKAQSMQEASKAKRFRDRGGSYQPLSPSKNKLMALFNSGNLFEDLEEEPQPAAEPVEEAGPRSPPKSPVKKPTKGTAHSRKKAPDTDHVTEAGQAGPSKPRPAARAKSKRTLVKDSGESTTAAFEDAFPD